jgi:2-oxoglutarate ferredoxin oxidoreductase subunit gamma
LAVSETEVLYPYIGRPDIFVVMSAEGYEKYRDELKDDGVLIYEKDLVKADLKKGQPAFGVSSTRIAEELGRAIVQNIVMLGFFAAVTKIVPTEAMRAAVEESVPEGTQELNLRAFDAGCAAYEKEYGEGAAATEEEEELVKS